MNSSVIGSLDVKFSRVAIKMQSSLGVDLEWNWAFVLDITNFYLLFLHLQQTSFMNITEIISRRRDDESRQTKTVPPPTTSMLSRKETAVDRKFIKSSTPFFWSITPVSMWGSWLTRHICPLSYISSAHSKPHRTTHKLPSIFYPTSSVLLHPSYLRRRLASLQQHPRLIGLPLQINSYNTYVV